MMKKDTLVLNARVQTCKGLNKEVRGHTKFN